MTDSDHVRRDSWGDKSRGQSIHRWRIRGAGTFTRPIKATAQVRDCWPLCCAIDQGGQISTTAGGECRDYTGESQGRGKATPSILIEGHGAEENSNTHDDFRPQLHAAGLGA